jgi:hypothetical protein
MALGDLLTVSIRQAFLPLLVMASMIGGLAQAAPDASSVAQDIYATAPPRLLQIRTLVADAGQRQTTVGSGFLVSADGLAAVLTQQSQPRLVGGGPFRKWYTPERCQEDFVRVAADPMHPPRGSSGARRVIAPSRASMTSC